MDRLKLYIIRHAQPANQEGTWKGPNPPLGEKGKEQARRMAQQMVDWGGVDYIYSSTLARTLETTEPLAEALPDVPWHIWPMLCECGRGSWPKYRTPEGLMEAAKRRTVTPEMLEAAQTDGYHPLLTDLQKRYPRAIFDQPMDWPNEWWFPLEAETREISFERARTSLRFLRQRHGYKNHRVAVLCHGAFGSAMVNILTESPECDHTRYHHSHASITRVDLYEDETVSVRFLNYQGHFTPDLITEGVAFP